MSRTLASIRILARMYDLQQEAAAAVRSEIRRIVAREKNVREITFDGSASHSAPSLRGLTINRIALDNTTVRLHDDARDTTLSEYVLSAMELLSLLKDLEGITALIDRGDVTISNGVLMRT